MDGDFSNGGPGASNPVTADPDYVALNLGQSPASDGFDEAYRGTLTCARADNGLQSCGDPNWQTGSPAPYSLSSEDILPAEANYDAAAATVLAANDPALTKQWSSQNRAPDSSHSYWGTVGYEIPGQTFMWALNDMPDLAAYGLASAALCNPAATGATASADCVQPSTASVTAALNSATPDSAGLLQVNPATVPSGAYPLVDVVYAAVPTNQSAQALSDYANFISYAAGPGQTPGTAPGSLPAGYLPLPASLQAQAQSVATQLRALANTGPTPVLSVTESPSPPEANQTTTLTATVTGGNGTPTGTVQFTVGGTAVGNPVPLSPQGTASTTVVFAASGLQQLTAVYTPDTSKYASTSVTWTENVLPAGSLNTDDIPLAVGVPVAGSFSLTVQTQNALTLTASADGTTACDPADRGRGHAEHLPRVVGDGPGIQFHRLWDRVRREHAR